MDEEKKRTRGHFRLFFGMAAGVGKTYQMLQAARERHSDGADVRVGIVETHGRNETQKMLAGLPVIPRKTIQYRGTTLEEMDLDAILALKPKLVLVDELAHTNAPGTRHEKRYQDVIELLDAGIDVYSTMNVQHLESRADIVGLITATHVRETVPDSVLDLVDQVELIDITPDELIDRLKEGKIYPGRKTEQALQYFFQEANLSALREIVLRVTADKVERDMRGVRPSQAASFPANTSGKLLVAVGHSPFSEKLIRTARRMVEDLEIPWVAIHVDTEKVLEPKDQNQLVKNLDLAQEMGAQTVTLHGVDVVETISTYAEAQKITQIIVGRPHHRDKRWARQQRFIESLIKKNPNIDITILQQPAGEPQKTGDKPRYKWEFGPLSILQAVLSVIVVACANYLLDPYVGYKAVGFLFLFLVVVLSTFLPFTAVLTAAVLSGGIWDYFFIPPRGTMSVKDFDDAMMLLAYLVISCVSGFLTFQVKRNQRILKDREEKTQALYEILKSMTLVRGTKPLIDLALLKIENLFNAECCVLIADNGRLSHQPDFGKLELAENDHAVAAWSYSHGRKAGWSTDTLPLSRVYCLALKSGEMKFGVLALRPKVDKKFNPEQENLLISIANQIGIVLAKENYDEENRQAKLVKESEKLHQTLLNCVSHELRTPLTAIMGAATAIGTQVKDAAPGSPLKLYSEEIISASARLNHVFENLLDVTRIESGSVKLNREWFDLAELVRFAMDRQKRLLAGHEVELNLPAEPFYFFGDYELLAHAFSNILLNAANYSSPNDPIAVTIKKIGNKIAVEVSDKGPGIPKESVPRLFEKFYRLPGTPAGGLGLGLSITKNLVELHDGSIQVRNNADKGATFSLVFPRLAPPKQIEEEIQ
jgi:two-component system sensor histidine kinase KdpD